jgi:hypothetical protein
MVGLLSALAMLAYVFAAAIVIALTVAGFFALFPQLRPRATDATMLSDADEAGLMIDCVKHDRRRFAALKDAGACGGCDGEASAD